MCPNPFKSPSPPPAPAPVAYTPQTTTDTPGQSFEEFVRDIIRRQTLGS